MTAPLTMPLPEIASQFNLRRDITFLNHGSFGSCPREVIAEYRRWQDELESEPVHFFGRRRLGLIEEARIKLGAFVNAHADDLVFVPNITYGMNIVVNSLRFEKDDEILTTDHEYGAINNTWEYHLGRHRRRPRPRPHRPRFDRPGCRLLLGQLPQMAVRSQGRRLFV